MECNNLGDLVDEATLLFIYNPLAEEDSIN
jgi:hypothetical protein